MIEGMFYLDQSTQSSYCVFDVLSWKSETCVFCSQISIGPVKNLSSLSELSLLSGL